MAKYLLKHGHIVPNGNREYLDGAILIEGDKILEVYPDSNIENDDCIEIDLHGQLLMPKIYQGELSENIELLNTRSLRSLVKLSLNDNYVLVDVDKIDDMTLLFIRKNIRRNRFILRSLNVSEAFLRMKNLGFSYCDLVLMSSINLYEASGVEVSGLLRGLRSDFVVLDKDFHVIFEVDNGEFIYD